ncbi:hypothetical protein [Streptomyces gobiensis]|uniref:hypothetical protein n=1 Tax=Streptomyces gobiensis TaxID=2875706 RepID=UPI001E63E472|nr:hypothetical protein [Streptomyces gobiensis]UGY91243.1 hypothetical protein test1122_05600 [Streptomyces gobiensis]
MTTTSDGTLNAHQDAQLAVLIRKWLEGEDQSVPVGRWWDIVVSRSGVPGNLVLQHMDTMQPGGCGPFIADPEGDTLFWLVPPGTIKSWMNEHGLCFAGGTKATLPPVDKRRPPGPYWLRPLDGSRLVDPDLLHRALIAMTPTAPPSREGTQLKGPELPPHNTHHGVVA